MREIKSLGFDLKEINLVNISEGRLMCLPDPPGTFLLPPDTGTS